MGCVLGRQASSLNSSNRYVDKEVVVSSGRKSQVALPKAEVVVTGGGVVVQEESAQEKPPRPRRRLRPGSIAGQAVGDQVAAGWPQWLSEVAGEAIKGWTPRRADSFEKLAKVIDPPLILFFPLLTFVTLLLLCPIQIGQGTYSNVYKARDTVTGKIVALKKVRFDNLEPESVKFMAREILILRRLDHPNVVKLEGLVTSRMSCSLYLVFEYMEHDLAGLAACTPTKFTEPQVGLIMHPF